MRDVNYLSSHLSTITLVLCSKIAHNICTQPSAKKPVVTIIHGELLNKLLPVLVSNVHNHPLNAYEPWFELRNLVSMVWVITVCFKFRHYLPAGGYTGFAYSVRL